MNDLMRPALYNANIKQLQQKSQKKLIKFMNLLVQYVKPQINFLQ